MADASGLQTGVVFGSASPLADNAEIVRRMLDPVTAAKLAGGQSLHGQAIDLRQEKFSLYVPSEMPPGGYGLLVFVPPWDDMRLPSGWAPVLDANGVIFVSAERSGNDMNDFSRRIPLALLAVENVKQRYRIDPDKMVIGGFSGGSRVAMRLALAYPDVFSGALLDGGADPIGTTEVPLPPDDLLHRFQENTRVLFLAGEHDVIALNMSTASRHSLRGHCVANTQMTVVPSFGHEIIEASVFSRALGELLKPPSVDETQLAACRASEGK